MNQVLAIAYWEWQILRRERGFQVTLLLLLILSAFALWNGVQRQQAWHATVADVLADETRDRGFLLSAFDEETDVEKVAGRPLSRNERGRAETLRLVAKLPTSLAYFGGTTHALQFPSRLASISTLNIERFPNRFLINGHSKRTVLERADLSSPYSQLTGPFDLAMMVGLVVPLFVIVLCYDVVSSERELGLLALTSIQSARPVFRFGIKILVRLSVPALILVCAIVLGSSLSQTDEPEVSLIWRTSLLCISTVAYLGIWGALGLLVNTFSASSTANAILLLVLWCAFAMLSPSVLSAGATRQFPAPTGSELVKREREIQAEVTPHGRDLQAAYYEAHPEDRPDDNRRDRFGQARWDIISHHVDQKMAEVIGRRYTSSDLREKWLGYWQAISPAVAWRRLVDELSGVSEEQFVRFGQAAGEFHTTYKAYFLPGMMSRREFGRSDVESMPRFIGRIAGDDLTINQIIESGTVLLAWLIVLVFCAAVRLLRLSPV